MFSILDIKVMVYVGFEVCIFVSIVFMALIFYCAANKYIKKKRNFILSSFYFYLFLRAFFELGDLLRYGNPLRLRYGYLIIMALVSSSSLLLFIGTCIVVWASIKKPPIAAGEPLPSGRTASAVEIVLNPARMTV